MRQSGHSTCQYVNFNLSLLKMLLLHLLLVVYMEEEIQPLLHAQPMCGSRYNRIRAHFHTLTQHFHTFTQNTSCP